MNKRDVMLSLLDGDKQPPYIPAAFFLHFDPLYHRGQAAVEKHLEYFNYTDMDFVKIQYETVYPHRPEISRPEDWVKMPLYGADFYQDQWDITKGLVQAAGKNALVLMTLYSPFMCAGHTVGESQLTQHILENPHQVKRGLEVITDSLLTFVRGCIKAGVDGFYHSTQGGETNRFEGSPLFDDCIRPYDLALMQEINDTCQFNILHICDYYDGYTSLTPFLDYPGDVVNTSLHLGSQTLTGQQVSAMFERPFMGGVNRLGLINTGNRFDIKLMITDVLKDQPERYILGADCTLPGDVNWDNIKTAIAAAHSHTEKAQE